MRILISNDDGIFATGIRKLAERLAAEKDFEVFVVAPDRERSATGHALTLHKPLRVEEVDLAPNVKGAWAVTGTPSDCVKFAVIALLKQKPDIVISGINNGANLGNDVLYSGTVSAAMEGAFLHIPSIAVSLVTKQEKKHWETAADFVAELIHCVPKAGLQPGCLLNVNVPSAPMAEISGYAITKLGYRLYNDHFEKRTDPRGKIYYWLAGHAIEESDEPYTDTWAVNQKMISVTPIAFNMTDHQALEKLMDWSELHQASKRLFKFKPAIAESKKQK